MSTSEQQGQLQCAYGILWPRRSMADGTQMEAMNKFNMGGEFLFASWTPNGTSEFAILLLVTFAFCFLIEFMMFLKQDLKENSN